MIKLAEDTIDNRDIDFLIDWLKTYPRLTKGPITEEFEKEWSKKIQTKYSVFVNSGSSANLLMLASLLEAGLLLPGDKVIVPALSWATDLAPVMQLGLTPILCDCNLNDFSISLDHFKEIVSTQDIKCLILVYVLGFVPDLDSILKICKEKDILLLEDCCEALGSEYKGKPVGSFGMMSSFSLYFGHHLSTIEGGMVCTSFNFIHKFLLSVRSHGWARDLDSTISKDYQDYWKVSDFDSQYTFYNCGFNLRSTDLQAFIGLNQIKKILNVVSKRNENYKLYSKLLGDQDRGFGFVSNFAYPIISENRNEIINVLEKNNIEVRPLICGNMGTQPFYISKYGRNELPNAEYIKKFGLYLPNHHLLTKNNITFICNLIKDLI